MTAKKILIIKLSAIGDVIHTLPCLNALRTSFPDSHISWIAQKPSTQLLEGHPQLDNLIIFPRKEWKNIGRFLKESGPFCKMLRSHQFDVAIDFQGLTKSGLLAKACGAKIRIGFGDKDGKRELNGMFTNQKVFPAAARKHIIERNLSLLQPLGIDVMNSDSVVHIPHSAEEPIDNFFKASFVNEQSPIALNPGAGWITKLWPLQNFAQLGVLAEKKLNRKILLVWGPGEKEMVDEIEKLMKDQGAEPIIAPPTNLLELAATLKRCSALVAGDTGPMHLAAALKIPSVALFGASDSLRNGPFQQPGNVLQNWDIDCVPCWKKQCNHSPQFECMHSLSVEMVLNKLAEIKVAR